MHEAQVRMKVHRADERIGAIEIQGELTGFAENVLMDSYAEASAGNPSAILLDFTQLEYMNSSGIGLLVKLLIRARRKDQKLLAVGLSEHYRNIFELTRLDEAIHIYGTQDEAIASLGGA